MLDNRSKKVNFIQRRTIVLNIKTYTRHIDNISLYYLPKGLAKLGVTTRTDDNGTLSPSTLFLLFLRKRYSLPVDLDHLKNHQVQGLMKYKIITLKSEPLGMDKYLI